MLRPNVIAPPETAAQISVPAGHTRKLLRFAAALMVCLTAAGALTPSVALAQSRIACHAPLRAMQQVELLFGRNIGDRIGVSETAWSRFLASEVTPRFPDGLTVLDSAGQWRDGRGRLVREPGKLVVIVAPDTAKTYDAAAAVAASYKRRFRQQSVGIVTRAVCAGF
jgi:hypothetical protein